MRKPWLRCGCSVMRSERCCGNAKSSAATLACWSKLRTANDGDWILAHGNSSTAPRSLHLNIANANSVVGLHHNTHCQHGVASINGSAPRCCPPSDRIPARTRALPFPVRQQHTHSRTTRTRLHQRATTGKPFRGRDDQKRGSGRGPTKPQPRLQRGDGLQDIVSAREREEAKNRTLI